MNKLGTNFAIFILFFGIATIQAFQTQNWFLVLFWVAIGLFFLWADVKKSQLCSKTKRVCTGEVQTRELI